jgi:hypothetical protein
MDASMKSLALLAALCIVLPATALAQSPAPAATDQASGEIQFTAHDVAALLKATKDAETSPNITINILGKDASEMPAYDPTVHFAGIDAKGAANIWMMKSPPKTEASAQALLAAMELACMATGYAGPQWKAIYDKVAGMDAALPANAPNPYTYRLALTKRIQSIIDSYKPHQ